MALFAISDLHLPAREKPMDVFGAHWENHFERIREDWLRRVGEEDVVLLPGDLTWAMRLEDAMEDAPAWASCRAARSSCAATTITGGAPFGRVRRALPEGMYALQNDAMELDGVLYAGSRAGRCPPTRRTRTISAFTRASAAAGDVSQTRARPFAGRAVGGHDPLSALTEGCEGVSDLLAAYGARVCVYGHLHGAALSGAFRGERNGVTYYQVSCDGLGFRLLRIPLNEE